MSPTNVCSRQHPGRAPRPDVERIRGELRRWTQQLPADGNPTLLVVHTRDLYAPVSGLGRYEAAAAIASRIANRLLAIPALSAMLLYEDVFLPPSAPVSIQHPFFTATFGASAAGMNRLLMLVLNPKATEPLRLEERAALLADPSGL